MSSPAPVPAAQASILQTMLSLLASEERLAALPAEDRAFLAKRLQPRFRARGEIAGQPGGLCLLRSGRVIGGAGEFSAGMVFRGRATVSEEGFCAELPGNCVDSLARRSPAFRRLLAQLPETKGRLEEP